MTKNAKNKIDVVLKIIKVEIVCVYEFCLY